MSQPLRTKGIDWTCGLMNWVSDTIIFPACDSTYNFVPRLRIRVGWWLESKLEGIFNWFYEGSDEEIRDGIEFACDDVDPKYLTRRQREVASRLSEWIDLPKTNGR